MKGEAVSTQQNMSDNKYKLPDGLDAETAKDVLRQFSSTEEAQVISKNRLDSLESEIKEAKEAFAAVLSEDSPQSADTLARQDMDALTEPFRDEDGDIDVDTLRQEPQTGDVGGSDGSDDGSSGFDADNIGLGTKEELDTLDRKRTAFKNRGMENRAEEIEQEMMDITGADSIDTLEKEVL